MKNTNKKTRDQILRKAENWKFQKLIAEARKFQDEKDDALIEEYLNSKKSKS